MSSFYKLLMLNFDNTIYIVALEIDRRRQGITAALAK